MYASPEWLCDLIGIGEWLHTGSRRNTRATERTETLDRSGKSAEWDKEENQEKSRRCWEVFKSMVI